MEWVKRGIASGTSCDNCDFGKYRNQGLRRLGACVPAKARGGSCNNRNPNTLVARFAEGESAEELWIAAKAHIRLLGGNNGRS